MNEAAPQASRCTGGCHCSAVRFAVTPPRSRFCGEARTSLDGDAAAALSITPFDGANWEANVEAIR